MGLKEDWGALLEKIRDEGLDDVADELDAKFSNTGLRRQLSERAKDSEEVTQLREEIALLKAGPKREAALKAVGVDYAQLSPAEREVVDSAKADEYDDGWARGLVEKYQLPVNAPEGGETEGIPAAEFGRPEGPAGQGAGQGGAKTGVLTLETYSNWPAEKRMRFQAWAAEHRPDAIAALDDGESVSGITFS